MGKDCKTAHTAAEISNDANDRWISADRYPSNIARS